MVVLRNIAIPAAALASVALGAPSRMSSLRRDDDPLGSKLPSGFDRGECTANDFSSDDSRKSVWETARGSELIDAYLNQNSRDDWATTILKTLFPEDGNSFDCWTSESTCDTNSHTCSTCSSVQDRKRT